MSHMKALLDSLDSRLEIRKHNLIKSASSAIGDLSDLIFYTNLSIDMPDPLDRDVRRVRQCIDEIERELIEYRSLLEQRVS